MQYQGTVLEWYCIYMRVKDANHTMVNTEEARKTGDDPGSSSFRNPKQSAKTSRSETTVTPDGAARANTTCRISKAIEEGKEPERAATLEFSV